MGCGAPGLVPCAPLGLLPFHQVVSSSVRASRARGVGAPRDVGAPDAPPGGPRRAAGIRRACWGVRAILPEARRCVEERRFPVALHSSRDAVLAEASGRYDARRAVGCQHGQRFPGDHFSDPRNSRCRGAHRDQIAALHAAGYPGLRYAAAGPSSVAVRVGGGDLPSDVPTDRAADRRDDRGSSYPSRRRTRTLLRERRAPGRMRTGGRSRLGTGRQCPANRASHDCRRSLRHTNSNHRDSPSPGWVCQGRVALLRDRSCRDRRKYPPNRWS